MSDCTTEAMKPKEPPVTAKVVIGATNELLIIERKGRYISVPAQILTREMRDENELYRFLINANRFDSMLSPSEQRYQQLEQVAKEMWRFMLSCAITIDDEEEVEPFKIQLEALVVSLDD